ncbi:hypothetical protein BDW22DRAFT_661801 [Trametopsis cervina]|nr:hypothetical protein BDW22DRAFT_661801 [Trametopsis cervina]
MSTTGRLCATSQSHPIRSSPPTSRCMTTGTTAPQGTLPPAACRKQVGTVMFPFALGLAELNGADTCCTPDPFVHCGVVDCDGPESALPPARNDIPTGWTTVVPCAIDNPQRVLANPVVTYLNSTTPYSCISQCSAQGYRYAGVEYGDECYCGTGYAGGVLPPAADVSECDMRCAGSFMNTCGGSWRMQIYKADGSP